MSTDGGQGSPAGRPRPRRRRRIVLADRRPTRQVGRTRAELEEQTSVGEALVRNLVRLQLRSAFLLFGVAVLTFTALPALFWSVPALGSAVIFGLRLPWLVLGVLPFPFVLLIGYLGARTAERHEREFLDDLVDQ